jgi:hypothetical protein
MAKFHESAANSPPPRDPWRKNRAAEGGMPSDPLAAPKSRGRISYQGGRSASETGPSRRVPPRDQTAARESGADAAAISRSSERERSRSRARRGGRIDRAAPAHSEAKGRQSGGPDACSSIRSARLPLPIRSRCRRTGRWPRPGLACAPSILSGRRRRSVRCTRREKSSAGPKKPARRCETAGRGKEDRPTHKVGRPWRGR